ncbi:RAD23 family protein [Rufibacter tibetensis]|uniref:hypothetical protein n=1 Tax=Rufibacter tibetensis TaxID=512763 RepID=UPI000784D6AC|nr:hypothetical protein [Rufibacter tibetensis]
MKKSTLLKGMRMLSLTTMIGLTSLAASAQTKAKTSTASSAVQTKAKTTSSVPAQFKAKASTAATTPAKPKTTAAPAQKKPTAPAIAAVTPSKPVAEVTSEPVTTAESSVEAKKQVTAAFAGGTNVVGIGFGLVEKIDYYGRGAKVLKPLTFSYERGLNVAAGPGVIGVGGTFSYAHVKWDEDYKISMMYIAAKGAYHYNFTQNEKLDTYAGLTLGYARSKADWDDSFMSDYEASEGEVKVGILAGARYYFTNSAGAHVELETGPISNITIGLNYRF